MTQDLPPLSWSDVMMFMVSTPSKESIRYFKYFAKCNA